MYNLLLKIPKKEQGVTMWVHPEGRVVGSVFLSLQSRNFAGEEEVLNIVNQRAPFLVLKRNDPLEFRFYNKAAIVRVEYYEGSIPESMEIIPLQCRLHMMDGSFIEGTIRRPLPPEHARLFDYLNLDGERFVKINVEDGNVCLVNKSYIAYVTAPYEDGDGMSIG